MLACKTDVLTPYLKNISIITIRLLLVLLKKDKNSHVPVVLR